ncbi:MAG: hypothetical protein KJ804_18005 [Proteobacteria bacterium]|nr:hypothetical protein [Pseudomonadota bacterium]
MARYLGQHSPSHATTRDVINKSLSGIDRPQVSFISLVPFLLIAFGLAWGILTLFIFLPEQMTDTVGELTGQHPLFFLAVYAPAIAALTITTCQVDIRGLRRFLSRLLLWRCSLAWYAFLLFGIPFLFFCGSAMKGNLFAEPFLPILQRRVFMIASLAAFYSVSSIFEVHVDTTT